jgi:hypothetical protein
MGMKLADLRSKTASVKVEFGDDTLTVNYRPNAITPNAKLMIFRGMDGGATQAERENAFDDFATGMAEIIESWDLLGEDGKPLPVTKDLLLSLPDALLGAIWFGVVGGNRPNGKPVAT